MRILLWKHRKSQRKHQPKGSRGKSSVTTGNAKAQQETAETGNGHRLESNRSRGRKENQTQETASGRCIRNRQEKKGWTCECLSAQKVARQLQDTCTTPAASLTCLWQSVQTSFLRFSRVLENGRETLLAKGTKVASVKINSSPKNF